MGDCKGPCDQCRIATMASPRLIEFYIIIYLLINSLKIFIDIEILFQRLRSTVTT
jgi:hypothetical protein